ncbi:hypothetical protein CPB86DRAFT_797119 [Serendipita vermifera]|nr:hypothetical protein CPB86DRAFT_797119 [Serendipita vermifera]
MERDTQTYSTCIDEVVRKFVNGSPPEDARNDNADVKCDVDRTPFEFGHKLQGQIGASWDLISWDPRGVLKSGPNITLFSTDEEYYGFWNQLEGKDHLNAHGNLTTQADADFFLSQAPAFDSFAKQINSLFVQKNGDKLKYIGSCAVVRDLVALTEMLYGQGADVNFWGISYGRWNWSQVSQLIFFHLYQGSDWPALNEILEGLVAEQANLTTTTTSKRSLSNLVPMKRSLSYTLPTSAGYGIVPANTLNLVVIAIACGDAIDVQNRTTEDLFRNLITISRNESSTFTSTQPLTNPRPFCHHWSSRAVERLQKPMNTKPKNVVLVIGNSEDVITPYSSARTLASSARLGNKARLVKFNAVGHGTTSNNSTCIDEVVKTFVNGSPPADAGNDEADVECNIDGTLFAQLATLIAYFNSESSPKLSLQECRHHQMFQSLSNLEPVSGWFCEENLNCFGSAFCLSTLCTILQERVKEVMKPRLDNFAPMHLILWKLEEPIPTGIQKKADLSKIWDNPTKNYQKMDPEDRVSRYFDGTPSEEHIHIIVGSATLSPIGYPSPSSVPLAPKKSPPLAAITDCTTPRLATVAALYERLNAYHFVLVRGTPTSGKSTLAELLIDYIKLKEGVEPVSIGAWDQDPSSPFDWLKYMCDHNYKTGHPNIVIIDDAQETYRCTQFWNNYLKTIDDQHLDRVILFASYSSAMGGVSQEVKGNGIGSAGILLTREEFDDMVVRAYSTHRFDEQYLNFIFDFTTGHVGAVKDMLKIVTVDESYKNLKSDELYSSETFWTQFPIKRLWDRLEGTSVFKRGLPKTTQLQEPAIARVFRRVLCYHAVNKQMFESKEDQDALEQCWKLAVFSGIIGASVGQRPPEAHLECPYTFLVLEIWIISLKDLRGQEFPGEP